MQASFGSNPNKSERNGLASGYMPRPDAEDIRRRIRAARVLAGMERVDDLAEAINRRGFARDTIYEVERGKRPVGDHELAWIAEATGIAPAFFRVDFATLGDQSGSEPGETLQEQLARHEALIRRLVAVALPMDEDESTPTPAPASERPGDSGGSGRRGQSRNP